MLLFFVKMYLETSIFGVHGAWSNEGCYISETQDYKDFLTCKCDHLTNFALLMDVSHTRHDSFALSVVTWIGCSVSLVGLVLTIITHLHLKYVPEAVVQRCSVKKGVLRNFTKFTGKHLCQCLFFNKVAGLLQLFKKETLAQVFSCQFCEISKNTFFL